MDELRASERPSTLSRPWTWDVAEAPCLDPVSLLDAGSDHAALLASVTPDDAWGAEAVFWDDGASVTVGLGAARTVTAEGASRWQHLADRAGHVWRHRARRGAPAEQELLGPAFFGGLAFRSGDSSWPDALFVLPRILYRTDGRRAALGVLVDDTDACIPAKDLVRLLASLPGAHVRRTAEILAIHRPDPDDWRATVSDALGEISAGRLRKVVAARPFDLELARPLALPDALRSLGPIVPGSGAVRFALRLRHAGNDHALVGRTPERLVRLDGLRVRTEALAGTAPNGAGLRLLGSVKDRHEHELVVDAIQTRLRCNLASWVRDASPVLRRSAGVEHLLTRIDGRLRRQTHLLDLGRTLHPTPAVCGLPEIDAARWIEGHEPESRGWYAGPVGHFDAAGSGELRVALRTAQLDGCRARVWAGAGLVAGSDPDAELAEIEAKARTVADAFRTADAPHRTQPARPVHVPFTRPA